MVFEFSKPHPNAFKLYMNKKQTKFVEDYDIIEADNSKYVSFRKIGPLGFFHGCSFRLPLEQLEYDEKNKRIYHKLLHSDKDLKFLDGALGLFGDKKKDLPAYYG